MLRLFTFSKAPNVSEKQAAPRLCFNVGNILRKICQSCVSQTQAGLGLFCGNIGLFCGNIGFVCRNIEYIRTQQFCRILALL